MKIDWVRVWEAIDNHPTAPELGLDYKKLIRRTVMKNFKPTTKGGRDDL